MGGAKTIPLKKFVLKPLIKPARRIKNLLSRSPYTATGRRQRWLDKEYERYGLETRKRLFLAIARFSNINRPIDGYYFEFGSHGGNTMRMAYDAFHHLFDWDYVAFDSFEGLPPIGEIDRQPIWHEGKLKTDEQEFVDICIRHGIPREKLHAVKGFYDVTLDDDLQRKFLPKKAAVIYVDCDLYESTVPVLRFIKPFLQEGTVLVFDDWNCFFGDPHRGERRAFKEFIESHPSLRFEHFLETGEAKAFIYLGETAPE